MNNNSKGETAEQMVIVEAMKRGWGVLMQSGGKWLPYDVTIDIKRRLIRTQVKYGGLRYSKRTKKYRYEADFRHSAGKKEKVTYKKNDFAFAIVVIVEKAQFFIIPMEKVLELGPSVVIESDGKLLPTFEQYKDKWDLIVEYAKKKRPT